MKIGQNFLLDMFELKFKRNYSQIKVKFNNQTIDFMVYCMNSKRCKKVLNIINKSSANYRVCFYKLLITSFSKVEICLITAFRCPPKFDTMIQNAYHFPFCSI